MSTHCAGNNQKTFKSGVFRAVLPLRNSSSAQIRLFLTCFRAYRRCPCCPVQVRLERPLAIRDESPVPRRVDEGILVAGLPPRVLLHRAKVAAVGTKEDVAG